MPSSPTRVRPRSPARVMRSSATSRIAPCAVIPGFGNVLSLLDAKSKFFAEIEQLKQSLAVPPDRRPVLFLVDEMLAGTNSSDRRKIAEALIEAFMDRGAVGALSTHDLALTDLANSPRWQGRNMHMAAHDDAHPLSFDYVLKPGVATQSSALAIARLAGLVLSS